MDFGSWSPSHTILVIFIVVGFVGQVAIYFYRTSQNDKKIDKQGETFFHALERLEDRMDKRFVEVINTMNQQISDVRNEISDVRSEISDVRSEIAGVRSEISDVRSEIAGVRSEMNQRLSDVNAEIRELNRNHIEHLNRHH